MTAALAPIRSQAAAAATGSDSGDGDTITDFTVDWIDVRGYGIDADNFDTSVTVRQNGDDVEIQIGDEVLTLTGVSTDHITVDDFILT